MLAVVRVKFFFTFAPQLEVLTYGVMVAQQILVLLVQVRILVGQQQKSHPNR
jgi:hypothetical protein